MFEFKLSEETPKHGPRGGVYDSIIIGAGAAGLTAAIYASRDGMKTLVLDRESAGGLAATTERIENYPGFPDGINGMELMERFRKQAERFGAEIVEFDEVVKIDPVQKGLMKVHTAGDEVYQGKTVVIATGSEPKKLNVPGEKEFYGRGVSYCATCDGPFFKGKAVIIVGAGNSGLQEGLQLLEYAGKVTVIEFLPYSRAEQILLNRFRDHEKGAILFNYQITEIKGDKTVTGVVAINRETQEEKLFPTDGVFIYAGYSPYSKFAEGLVETNQWGYILSDAKMRTRVEGLYAIGDVRADNPAQLSVAIGDGAKAALDIREYLQHLQE